MKQIIHFIYLTEYNFNYGWVAPQYAYDGLLKELGVQRTQSRKGILFGVNKPKPAKLRIVFNKETKGYYESSIIRFCSPNNIINIVDNNTLKGKKIKVNNKEYSILYCLIDK